MKMKKSQSLPINAIILAVLVLVVLVVLVVIFSSKTTGTNKGIKIQITKTDCAQVVNAAAYNPTLGCYQFTEISTGCVETISSSSRSSVDVVSAGDFCYDYFNYANKNLCSDKNKQGNKNYLQIIC